MNNGSTASFRSRLHANWWLFYLRTVDHALSVLNKEGWRDWTPGDRVRGLGRRILRDKTRALIWHDRILNNRRL